MNFKTTVILAVLLLIVGGYIMFHGTGSSSDTNEPPPAKKVIDVSAAEVQTFSISPADGKKMTFVREGPNDWKITEPIVAKADAGIVQAALDDLCSLTPQTKEVDVTDGTGLKSPRIKAELTTKDDKITAVSIGDRSSVGDRLYVQASGNDKADLVATGVDDELSKSLNDFRDKKLVDLTNDQIKYIAINGPNGKIELEKNGEKWQITSPSSMPADTSAVTDLLYSATGLRAEEFVDGSTTQPMYGLGSGAKSITLAASSPSATQPTTQPAPVTIIVGRADTILAKNLFVTIAGSNSIVKVPKESASFIDQKALDLRDKDVVDIVPAQVNKLTVTVDHPATTQPTKKAEEKTTISVVRRPPPATQPATTQASTAPSTQPKPSTWTTADAKHSPASDSAVEAILNALHPLRAVKFVDTAPTQGTTLTVQIDAGGGGVLVANHHELQIVDPGESKSPVATYDGAHFEVERTLITQLEAKFDLPSTVATPARTSVPEPQMP